jgi:hypothetical protein
MRDSTGKWVSAADLISTLQQLPPSSRVYPNQLQRLSVTSESGDELIGLIDFNYGCFDSFEGDYEDDD